MDIAVGFFIKIFELIFSNVFSVSATYAIILLIIKLFGIWKVIKKNNDKDGFATGNTTRKLNITICPRCGNASTRVNRTDYDKARNILSLNLLKWKKYTCYSCYWEGSRWD